MQKGNEYKGPAPALLQRRGWIRVGPSNIGHLINHQNRRAASYAVMFCGFRSRMGGWIKPPAMKLHTTREAYEEEGFVYANL